jgi:hypothetical protein
MDLRYNISLLAAHIVDEPVTLENLGIEGTMRVRAGQPDSSILYLRMLTNNEFRMPPLATAIIDTQGSNLIRDWIYSLGNPNTSVSDKMLNISTYYLPPAFPNPFNAETTIRFAIPKHTHVSLLLYDVRGKRLEQLLDKNFSPGKYTYKLRADNYASGVYIYQLKTSDFIKSRKILLLK